MKKSLLSVVLLCALAACDDTPFSVTTPAQPAPVAASDPVPPPVTTPAQHAPVAASEPAPVPAPPPAPSVNVPDVGKIEQVSVTAKGVGMTPGAAVNDALKIAIMQVNGVTINASSANLNFFAEATATLDVYSKRGHDSAQATAQMQGQAFADRIVTQSRGVISSFKVLNVVPPSSDRSKMFTASEEKPPEGSYVVEIEARVAKFQAPADAGKIKIVVAPLRTRQASFNIGGRSVPASDVLAVLHRQIVDALAQTGRFTVLDRQFEDEIENELDMISSGNTVNTTFAKLGQALSADLVWVGEVDNFAYKRSARKLQTSDRELVSYSGGWQISQRLINLTTRQIQQSSTLKGTLPSIAPTTLGAGIDENKTVQTMQADVVKQATEAILLRSFPITIVDRTGNQVVLSQGGAVLKEKSRYRVYLLGKELKDPQTGQSLGRMESPCCEVIVDRVTPNLSYATLENIQIPLDDVQIDALQIREALAASVARASDEAAAAITPKAKSARKSAPKDEDEAAPKRKKERDDW
jgi:hypothetical protein